MAVVRVLVVALSEPDAGCNEPELSMSMRMPSSQRLVLGIVIAMMIGYWIRASYH